MDKRIGRLVALVVISAGLVLTLVHNSLELGQRVVFGDNPPMLAALTLASLGFAAAYVSLIFAERRRLSMALECLTIAIFAALAVSYISVWRSLPAL
jgi:hypothetical protein